MDAITYWLPLVWIGILGIAVAMYVVLDGFDLGLGILFPFNRDEADRDVMMNSVAPFWDGNETWLILGGGGLLVAFPIAYGVILSGLYLPVMMMLLALVFRGVAFEFRWVAKPNHSYWDTAFTWGSIVASFMQGVILGGLLQGLKVENGAFAGGPLDWFAPFPLFIGLATVAGYALLGATWLIMKTEGHVAETAGVHASILLPIVLASMAIVSLWTPLTIDRIWERWFTYPNFILLSPIPLLTALAAFLCWRGLERREDTTPFFASVSLFLLGFAGLAISNLPYLVPPSLTVWQTAAHPSSQLFMLVGTLILLPVILGYTVFVYWTFRGKIRHGEGYH
jgi:cytochrome bd ubiquinol oxidase subunit II